MPTTTARICSNNFVFPCKIKHIQNSILIVIGIKTNTKVKQRTITVQGTVIKLTSSQHEDYINLTDMARGFDGEARRYEGTYAHNEIALQFAAWLSPEFYVYLVKEFKRLKTEEAKNQQGTLEWTVKRMLSKINYKIQTDAIKNNLIPAFFDFFKFK